MRRHRVPAIAALAAGLGCLAVAAARGELRVGLALIVPFVYGEGLLPFAGAALLLAATFLWMRGGAWEAGAPREHEPARPGGPERSRVRSGGVALLGPIPVVWGTDRRILPWMVAAGAALLALALVLTLLSGR